MNRYIICTGDVADTPYYFDKAYVNVYTAEELCYVLYENAFLIEQDIVDKNLVDWIDGKLHLHELARNLYSLLNQGTAASAFVGMILEYVGFYSTDEIDKVESILKMNVSMNVYEKWKAKADFLYENNHALLAIREYENLLASLEDEDFLLMSRVYNNIGVCYMSLRLYDMAVENFKKSYEIDNNEAAHKHYLTAKRLKLTENEYIRMIADDEETYRMSIPIESEYKETLEEFDRSDFAKRLNELFDLKNQKEAALYYEEVARISERLKNEYRDTAIEADQLA